MVELLIGLVALAAVLGALLFVGIKYTSRRNP
jgi:hypothetical protein